MIEKLLQARKISQADFDLYTHYQVNELGRKLLGQGTMKTFMDEPSETEFTGERLAYYEGRRSVFKDIHEAILRIEQLIKESLDDSGSQHPN
jgi:hypothetical protein